MRKDGVDAYLCGEVHDHTVIRRKGVVQMCDGGRSRCHRHPQPFGSNRHGSTHIHIHGLVHSSHLVHECGLFLLNHVVATLFVEHGASSKAAVPLHNFPGISVNLRPQPTDWRDDTPAVATWAAARGAAIECKDDRQAILIN